MGTMNAGDKRHPGGLSFADFSLAEHKFAWSEFEQPIGWPAGRKPGMVFVAKSISPAGARTGIKTSLAPAKH